MLLEVVSTCLTVTLLVDACSGLCANTDSIADLDSLDLGANSDSVTNNLVTNT